MEESRAFAAAPPERPKVLGTVKQPALFMPNVPMDTSQNDVYNHFTKQKDIKINRVEMSLSGNPSLGIDKQKLNAIIHFYDHDEADRVLQYYKIQKFRERQYCLTWYEPQPNKERREWNLFVGGIPPSWGSEQLIEEFSPYGSIVSCKANQKESGATKGFGWIQFQEQKSAQAAIDALNDKFVKEHSSGNQFKLSVTYHNSHKSCSIFVSNIPASIFNEDSLSKEFAVFGTVQSVSLLHTKIPPSAFVNFETVEAAQKAIQEAKNISLPDDNRGPLHVSPQYTRKELQRQSQHQQRGEETKGSTQAPPYKNYQDSNLFVRPIPPGIDEAEVKEVFSKYGDVQSLVIRSIRNDPSNRKAYVLLGNSTQAFNAIKGLDGKAVWNVMLSVKIYESATERRKQYQQNIQGGDVQNPFAMFYTFMQLLMYNQGVQRPHHQFRNNYGGGSGYSFQNTYQGDQLPGADGYGFRGRGRGGYNRGQQRGQRGEMRGNAPRGRRGGHGGGYHGHQLPGPPPQNLPQPVQQPAPPPLQGYVAQPVTQEMPQNTEESLVSKLNSMGQDERRQFIGNTLFPEVQKKLPLNAGKITGMLVDLNTEQVVQIMTNQDQLNSIIDQAYQQLQQSGLLVAEETPLQ